MLLLLLLLCTSCTCCGRDLFWTVEYRTSYVRTRAVQMASTATRQGPDPAKQIKA